jgi:hypothetical protein
MPEPRLSDRQHRTTRPEIGKSASQCRGLLSRVPLVLASGRVLLVDRYRRRCSTLTLGREPTRGA